MPPADWLHSLKPFSAFHLFVVAIAMAAMLGAVLIGRQLGDDTRRRFERFWGWSILIFQTTAVIWWLLPANFDAQRSIPLNVCRLAAWIAAIAMLTDLRWPRVLLYFWGLGLSTQAFITPVFPEGPAHFVFWIFWLGHTQIVGTALYDLIIRRYRPTARDFAAVCLANAAYLAVAIPTNIITGLNYGGLGRTLFDAPNLAHRLGPWPWRPIWIILIAQAWMTFLYVIWLRAWRPRSPARTPPSTPPPSTARPRSP